jgi:hypothetical protein
MRDISWPRVCTGERTIEGVENGERMKESARARGGCPVPPHFAGYIVVTLSVRCAPVPVHGLWTAQQSVTSKKKERFAELTDFFFIFCYPHARSTSISAASFPY